MEEGEVDKVEQVGIPIEAFYKLGEGSVIKLWSLKEA